MAQWLLEEGGADIADAGHDGQTVWSLLEPAEADDDELASLLKVMLLLSDAPDDFFLKLESQHVPLILRGQNFRVQLPAYLEQQWAEVINHCTLPAALRPIVAAYAATTPQDMWLYGLQVQAPAAKRAIEDEDSGEDGGEGTRHCRRSRRLRQKRG
jgi:hypothetical protein